MPRYGAVWTLTCSATAAHSDQRSLRSSSTYHWKRQPDRRGRNNRVDTAQAWLRSRSSCRPGLPLPRRRAPGLAPVSAPLVTASIQHAPRGACRLQTPQPLKVYAS